MIERRERLAREQAELEQYERDHRRQWRDLLRVVPGMGSITFVDREHLDTQDSVGTEHVENLHPTFRPGRAGEGCARIWRSTRRGPSG